MPEADLPEAQSYEERLIYKWSWRGELDRKIRRIKRLGKKRYMKAGLVVGLVIGIVIMLIVVSLLGVGL